MSKVKLLSDSQLVTLYLSARALRWTGSCVVFCRALNLPLSTANLVRESHSLPWTCARLLPEELSGEASERKKAEWFTWLRKEPAGLRLVYEHILADMMRSYTS